MKQALRSGQRVTNKSCESASDYGKRTNAGIARSIGSSSTWSQALKVAIYLSTIRISFARDLRLRNVSRESMLITHSWEYCRVHLWYSSAITRDNDDAARDNVRGYLTARVSAAEWWRDDLAYTAGRVVCREANAPGSHVSNSFNGFNKNV